MFPPKSKKGFLGRQEFQMKGWISRAANKLVSPSLFPVPGPSRQLDFSCNTPTFKALQVTLPKESNNPTFKALTSPKESNNLFSKLLESALIVQQGVFPKMEGYLKIVPNPGLRLTLGWEWIWEPD